MALNWTKFKGVELPHVPKWVVGSLALGLLAIAGYVAYSQISTAQRQEARRKIQTATVEKLDLPVTITANGTVQPDRSVNVSPKNSGILKQLLVKEGDRVEAGQVLAYMDDSNLQGQFVQAQAQLSSSRAALNKLLAGNRPQEVAQAQAQLNSAQANLAKLLAGNRFQDVAQSQAQLTSAQANLRQAELTYRQNQQLYTAGAIALRDLDTSRATFDTARAQVEQNRQAFSLQRSGSRPEDIAAARAQVEQAKQALSLQAAGARSEDIEAARAQVLNSEGALKTIQTQINDTVIRAPFSGTVTRKFADPGSFVTPTTSGSTISSATSSSILSVASNNEVVVKVPETSIPKIKVGLPVTIEADAYSGKFFKGIVTQVATQSTVDQNVTNFQVQTSVIDPQNLLRSGMNVNTKFNVGTLKNALVVPTVAIVRQAEGTGVYLAGGGRGGDRSGSRRNREENGTSNRSGSGRNREENGTSNRRRSQFTPIVTGVSVEDKTVVTSGLSAGDRVLLSFPQGERPASRTPSVFPGLGGSGGGGGGRRGGGL